MQGQEKPEGEYRPSVLIRSLHNLIGRYLSVTTPQEARSLSGANMQIIVFLDKHPDEEIFQNDIERRFSITRSTASRVLGLMESKGLIERRSVERDARLKRIVLTDQAKSIAHQLEDNADQLEDKLFEGFSAEERRMFIDQLLAMKRNLLESGKIGAECARQVKDHEEERKRYE